MHSSNHAEQAESQFELIRSFLPTAATGAANLQRFFNKSCEADTGPGLTFPSHIAPWGYTASIGPTPMGDQRIRWNGELAMTVLLWCVRGHLEALLSLWPHGSLAFRDWEYSRNRTTDADLAFPHGACREMALLAREGGLAGCAGWVPAREL